MNNIFRSAVLAACCLAFTNVAFAQGYLGASLGVTEPNEEGFEDDNGFKLTLGYKLNQNFALEASYLNLGEFAADSELLSVMEYLAGESLEEVTIEITGFEFSAIGFAPITDNAAFFMRMGVLSWDADLRVETTWYGSGTVSEDGNDPFLGAGFYVDLSEQVGLKVEFIRYDAFDGDVDFMGAGLHLKF